MNARLAIVTAFAVGTGVGLIAGCQTYDFSPVQPLALSQTTQTRDVVTRNLKPNVMLLVDKSASMDEPVDPSEPNCSSDAGLCGQGKGYLCDTNPSSSRYCPTRWSELQGAMSDFLGDAGTVARLGMAVFPNVQYGGSAGSCALQDGGTAPDGGVVTPAKIRVDIVQSNDVTSELQAQANTIKQELLSITSSVQSNTDNITLGGTPTQNSLRYLGTDPLLNDSQRQNFVLVLTDGLPNCNPGNPNDYSSPQCRCTIGATCPSSTGALGCLDESGTVGEVTALRSQNIRTIVIGFGAETATSDAKNVLNNMAAAGGMARACPDGSDSACAPDTCNQTTKLCNTAFYQAANRTQLFSALAEIGKIIGTADPCVFPLVNAPSDPALVSVVINGTVTPSGPDTWTYDPATTTVKLVGALCTQAQNATPASPVKVEIRALQGL